MTMLCHPAVPRVRGRPPRYPSALPTLRPCLRDVSHMHDPALSVKVVISLPEVHFHAFHCISGNADIINCLKRLWHKFTSSHAAMTAAGADLPPRAVHAARGREGARARRLRGKQARRDMSSKYSWWLPWRQSRGCACTLSSAQLSARMPGTAAWL